MTATSFIDTNVLLYAASNAPADQAKRQIARGLLGQVRGCLVVESLRPQPIVSDGTPPRGLEDSTPGTRRHGHFAGEVDDTANGAK